MPMKHPAIWPNIITAFALSCGLFVIFKMSQVEPGAASYPIVLACVKILLVAALLDLLDGAVARVMKVESDFGGVFDSLADAISFGVAPSVIILKAHPAIPNTPLYFFLMTGAIIYSISGVLRLVRFTVNRYQIQGDIEKMTLAKASFTGLPIPAGFAVSTSTTLFLMSDESKLFFSLSDTERSIIAILVFFLVGYFMISRWKFPSLKTLHFRIGTFQAVLITAFMAAIILLGAIYHFALLMFAVSWLYLITAWVLSIVRLISGKRLKALEDFDPEQEE